MQSEILFNKIGEGLYQEKTVSSSITQQIILPDDGYDALSQVTVNAFSLPNAPSKTATGSVAKRSYANISVSQKPKLIIIVYRNSGGNYINYTCFWSDFGPKGYIYISNDGTASYGNSVYPTMTVSASNIQVYNDSDSYTRYYCARIWY